MRPRERFALILGGGLALSLVGMLLGLWWLTFVAAVGVGLAVPRTWVALAAGAVTGLVAWSEPLLVASAQYGLKSSSLAIAAILGAKGAALVPVALTIVIGVLLGSTGAWLGSAVRSIVLERLPSGAVQNSVTSDWK